MKRVAADILEFRLLRGCCHWNFANGPDDRPDIPAKLDWGLFVRLARFHRVQGLIWKALAPTAALLPSDASDALSSDARSIAATNLAIARECTELRDAFAMSNVPLYFLKGLTVAALAYRSPMLKMGWDIDVLIDPVDLRRAASLLTARGFSLRLPASLTDLESWHLRSKESVWGRADSLHVELHTRLADNAALIPNLNVHSPSQPVEVAPGISLSTLGEDELFAYLCVHGASSAWFRLKWISDFAALLHRVPEREIRRLYARSQDLGAHRAAGQALLLADRLFGTLAGSTLSDELMGDRANSWLAAAAFRQLACRSEPREPTVVPLGTWRIHLTQLLLKRKLAFKLNELYRQLADAIA